MRWDRLQIGVLAVGFAIISSLSCSRAPTKTSIPWNPKSAIAYLDRREEWWDQWVGAARDHGTFCVSCHTALPFALARPALRAISGEHVPSPDEQFLIDDVVKRVRLWKETSPYYSDEGYDTKAAESRGTEAVLNALVLANYDAERGNLSEDTRAAFQNMWVLQQTTGDQKGAWTWLQFDQEPWEAKDSAYYGACLAAIATGSAPEHYSANPNIQPYLARLRTYLRDRAATQSTLNRIFLLWASTKLPGLLSVREQQAIIREAFTRQQSDGGWRLATITWSWKGWNAKTLVKMWLREKGTPLRGESDSVATGLIVYVLQEAGVAHDDPGLQRGLFWLRNNQTDQGDWPATSVNRRSHVSSNTRLFMNDAGTAFAVLALTDAQGKKAPASSPSIRIQTN